MPRRSRLSSPRTEAGNGASTRLVATRLVVDLDPPRAPIPMRVRRRFEDESNDAADAIARETSASAPSASADEAMKRELNKNGSSSPRCADWTPRRVATQFLNAKLSVPRESFEEFMALIVAESTISLTRAWLERVEARSASKVGSSTPRVVLSAYMILHHSDVVMGGSSPEEVSLLTSSRELVQALEAVAVAVAGSTASPRDVDSLVARFGRSWNAFYCDWTVWKTKDAQSLENELVRIGVAMEASMFNVCGPNALDETVCLGEERNAIREAQKHDRALLREKISRLSGDDAAQRFDAMICRVREDALRQSDSKSGDESSSGNLEQRREAREAMNKRMADAIANDKARSVQYDEETMDSVESQKDRILHELMINPEFKLSLAEHEAGSLRTAVEEAMTQAFWDVAYESLIGNSVSIVRERIIEWKDCAIDEALSSEDMSTQRLKDLKDQLVLIDVDDLERCILHMETHPLAACAALRKALDYGYTVLKILCDDDETNARLEIEHETLIHKLQTTTEDKESISRSIVDALAFLFSFREKIHTTKYLNAANLVIDDLRSGIAASSKEGFEYARERFLRRHGVCTGETDVEIYKLKFPRTVGWLEAVADDLVRLYAQENMMTLRRNSDATWRGIKLQSGLIGCAKERPQLAYIVAADLHSTAIMTIEGACRVALARLISNQNAIEQEFYPETLEFDLERLDRMWAEFQQLRVLAACSALCRQINVRADIVLERVSLLLNDPHEVSSVDKIAELIRDACEHKRDEAITIANMLRKLTGEEALAVHIVDILRSALAVRLLYGFQDDTTACRAVESTFAAFGPVAARLLRERVDDIARQAAVVVNLQSHVCLDVLNALAGELLSKVDPDEI